MRDVVTVLQRTEMVRRIAEEIEADIVELGVDGRLVRLQLEELMGGVEDDRRLVMRDYFHAEADWHLDQALDALAGLGTEDLLDLKAVAATLHLPGEPVDLDASVQPRGYRLLARIPRLPESVVERIVDRFGTLQKIMRATIDDLDDVDGRRRDPGPGHQGRPRPPGRDEHPRPLQLSLVPEAELRGRIVGLACGESISVARPASWIERRRGAPAEPLPPHPPPARARDGCAQLSPGPGR